MNHFSNLPEALFDNILQFTDVKDIISFGNTNEEHYDFVGKITTNPNTQVSKVYEMTDICDVETWIFLPKNKFKIKFAKQYYDIYKYLGQHFELEFKEVTHIFTGIMNLVKGIYQYEDDIEKNEKNKHIIMSLFEFISTNNHIFNGNFTVHDEEYNKRSKILHLLFKLYSQAFSFLDTNELEAIMICMFQDMIDRLENMEQSEKMDEFIVTYLEGFFYFTQDDTTYGDISYMKEMLEDIVMEAGMGGLFLIPEE